MHPAYARPELLAARACEGWSWDIIKIYIIFDIFSLYVVGWMIAGYESDALAEALIGHACDKEGIAGGQLTLHTDRGAAMRPRLATPPSTSRRNAAKYTSSVPVMPISITSERHPSISPLASASFKASKVSRTSAPTTTLRDFKC